MDRVVVHVRRAGLACVALVSVAMGVGTIWAIARPEVIGGVSTLILFGIVGLLVLPLVAVGALAVDRRAVETAAPARTDGVVQAVRLIGIPGEDVAPDGSAALAHTGVCGQQADAVRHDATRHRHLRVRVGLPE